MKNKSGFITLVEVLVVVSIACILCLLVISVIQGRRKAANNEPIKTMHIKTPFLISGDSNWQVKEISYEGCQYLYICMGNQSWGSHKGNCTSSVHHALRLEK
jgi:hypothetical protein